MNEQISDLMYQSGLTAQGCWDEMDTYDKQSIEKFAELIVRECMVIGDKALQDGKWPGDVLKEHFGIL